MVLQLGSYDIPCLTRYRPCRTHMPRGVAQFKIKNHLPSPAPSHLEMDGKNAGKNHALINRNYVRSRGRASAPLKHRSTSWPQLEQARVNKANARRDFG